MNLPFSKKRIYWGCSLFALSIILFIGYMHIYVYVLEWELPKLSSLKRENAALTTKSAYLMHTLQRCGETLDMLQTRDEDIYRSVFGLAALSSQTRSAVPYDTRYDYLREADRSALASNLRMKTDSLLWRSLVQSRSYDEIAMMLDNADKMSSSIPTICPVEPGTYRISSAFGFRFHPLLRYRKFHSGMDFAMKPSNPVFATGDGIVKSIKVEMKGYGRQLVIDHGFGYETRYAHLKTILVTEGMSVKRGQCVALTGNSGLSSGPHLHYEVIFRGKNVNPYHYFDLELSREQYDAMLLRAPAETQMGMNPDIAGMYVHPMHKSHDGKKKKK